MNVRGEEVIWFVSFNTKLPWAAARAVYLQKSMKLEGSTSKTGCTHVVSRCPKELPVTRSIASALDRPMSARLNVRLRAVFCQLMITARI